MKLAVVGLSFVLLFCCVFGAKEVDVSLDVTLVMNAHLLPFNISHPMIAINGSINPPSFSALAGSTINVLVRNLILDVSGALPVSVHFLAGSDLGSHPWADGFAACPVSTGAASKIKFVATSPGTHAYMVRAGPYVAMGALVVTSPWADPIESDIDHVLVVGNAARLSGLGYVHNLYPGSPANGDRLVLNARTNPETAENLNPCKDGSQDYVTIGSTPATQRAVCVSSLLRFDTQTAKKVRFRIINSADTVVNFAIASHQLSVSALDGQPIDRMNSPSVDILPGQRADVVVATEKDGGLYRMRFQNTWASSLPFTPLEVEAILDYAGDEPSSSSRDTLATEPSNQVLDWDSWLPYVSMLVEDMSAPPKTAVTQEHVIEPRNVVIDLASNTAVSPPSREPLDSSQLLDWVYYNNSRFTAPRVPYLLLAYNNKPLPRTIPVTRGEIVQIVLQSTVNVDGICVPQTWHLHGNMFWLLATGAGRYDAARDAAKLNLKNPALLDTVTVLPSSDGVQRGSTSASSARGQWLAPCGWAVIRFKASFSGIWALESSGPDRAADFVVVFAVSPSEITSVPDDVQYCGDIAAPGSKVDDPSPSPSHHHNASLEETGPFVPTRLYAPIVIAIFFATSLIVILAQQAIISTRPKPELPTAPSTPVHH